MGTGGGNRYPVIEREARRFYETTSKAVLMEICRDFAIEAIGEENGIGHPQAWLAEIERRHAILKANGLSK